MSPTHDPTEALAAALHNRCRHLSAAGWHLTRAGDEELRAALARAIEGGYADASIDPSLYQNDPVYHAIVWEIRGYRAALDAPAQPVHSEPLDKVREGVEALPQPTLGLAGSVSRAAVLALIEKASEPEAKE